MNGEQAKANHVKKRFHISPRDFVNFVILFRKKKTAQKKFKKIT